MNYIKGTQTTATILSTTAHGHGHHNTHVQTDHGHHHTVTTTQTTTERTTTTATLPSTTQSIHTSTTSPSTTAQTTATTLPSTTSTTATTMPTSTTTPAPIVCSGMSIFCIFKYIPNTAKLQHMHHRCWGQNDIIWHYYNYVYHMWICRNTYDFTRLPYVIYVFFMCSLSSYKSLYTCLNGLQNTFLNVQHEFFVSYSLMC